MTGGQIMNIKGILLSTTATLLISATTASAAQPEATAVVVVDQKTAPQTAPHVAKHKKTTKVVHHKPAVAKTAPTKNKTTVKKILVKAPIAADTILRSCGAFGPGYFHVPGTPTCLKLSGQISAAATTGSPLDPYFLEYRENTAAKLGLGFSGKLGISTQTQTSLGKLHSYAELRGGYVSGLGVIGHSSEEVRALESHNVNLHFAYAELGGLRIGMDESIFNTWVGGFGEVLNDNLLNPLEGTPVGTVNYTFNAGNGMSAILGAEVVNGKGDTFLNGVVTPVAAGSKGNQGENLNILGGVKYAQGWGDIIGVAAYDTYHQSFSGRVRVDGNISPDMSLWALASVKTLKDGFITELKEQSNPPELDPADITNKLGDTHFLRNSTRSIYSDWNGKWEALVGGTYKLTPNAAFNAQLGYDAAKTVMAAADVKYKLFPNVTIAPELAYIAWHDTTVWKGSEDNAKDRTNWLKDKHEWQAMLYLSCKF